MVSAISLPTSAENGLAATPQDGDAGETRVKLRHGDALVVRTRAGRAQLDALRRLLGAGFQPHLLHNPLLHQARARGRPGVLFFVSPLRSQYAQKRDWRTACCVASRHKHSFQLRLLDDCCSA